mmetsp:Transcript_28616/g.82853  ORF Transcript_28616/g.82853 Transcript_28616/m.82853 type:complete len:586 (-) Transcript_28616:733-2490(-)
MEGSMNSASNGIRKAPSSGAKGAALAALPVHVHATRESLKRPRPRSTASAASYARQVLKSITTHVQPCISAVYVPSSPKKRRKRRAEKDAKNKRRTDCVLASLATVMIFHVFLALTHFAPVHFLAAQIGNLLPTSAACRRAGLARCAHPRILYASAAAWGKDDLFEMSVNHTAVEEELNQLTLLSQTLVGAQEYNYLTMPRQEDIPTVRVKLHRGLQYGPMSEFEPKTCCHRYTHPNYEDVGENCELIAPEWQLVYRPTCNSIHEISIDDGTSGLRGMSDAERDYEADLLSLWVAAGDYRDVWAFADAGHPRVLKTLVYKQQQTRPKILKMFADEAAAMDHLHRSPYVATSHGLCGVSQVQDFSSQGGFKSPARKGKFTSIEKLKVATQVARAVSDVHDYNQENGRPSMAVADVSSGQFVFNEKTQTFVLQDMNMIMMLKKDENGDTCKFQSASSAGSIRSPEEYWETDHTEFVDIWALGNVIHYIMRGDYTFCDLDIREYKIKRYVKEGKEPPSFEEIEKDGDDIEKALVSIIKKTRHMDPLQRPTALMVRQYLEEQLMEFASSTYAFVDMKEVNERPSRYKES